MDLKGLLRWNRLLVIILFHTTSRSKYKTQNAAQIQSNKISNNCEFMYLGVDRPCVGEWFSEINIRNHSKLPPSDGFQLNERTSLYLSLGSLPIRLSFPSRFHPMITIHFSPQQPVGLCPSQISKWVFELFDGPPVSAGLKPNQTKTNCQNTFRCLGAILEKAFLKSLRVF